MNVVATVQTRLKHGIVCQGRHCHQFPTTLCVSTVGMPTPTRYLPCIPARIRQAPGSINGGADTETLCAHDPKQN